MKLVAMHAACWIGFRVVVIQSLFHIVKINISINRFSTLLINHILLIVNIIFWGTNEVLYIYIYIYIYIYMHDACISIE
jgi:hypothetical protein